MKEEKIKNIIKEISNKLGLHLEEIMVNKEDGSLYFQLKSNDHNLFIGKNGEHLSAFNHLARKIAEKELGVEEPISFIIDVNEFQKKKADNIKAIAYMMAERARFFKSNIEIDPMSAYDRRIIHEFLSTATDLKTESSGEGLNRRVVIKYIGVI